MEMVVLDTEMENPEAAVGGDGESAADGREDPAGSEAADERSRAERHVHRVRIARRRSGAAGSRYARTCTLHDCPTADDARRAV